MLAEASHNDSLYEPGASSQGYSPNRIKELPSLKIGPKRMQMTEGSHFVSFEQPKPVKPWAKKNRDSIISSNADQVRGLSTDRPKIRTAYHSLAAGNRTTRNRELASVNASIFTTDSANRPNTHRGQTNYMSRRQNSRTSKAFN